MKAHLWFILICIPDLKHRSSIFKKTHTELFAHVCLLASSEHLLLFWQNINLPTFLLQPEKHTMILSETKCWFFVFFFSNNHPRWNTYTKPVETCHRASCVYQLTIRQIYCADEQPQNVIFTFQTNLCLI